jgi:hypothetical protein
VETHEGLHNAADGEGGLDTVEQRLRQIRVVVLKVCCAGVEEEFRLQCVRLHRQSGRLHGWPSKSRGFVGCGHGVSGACELVGRNHKGLPLCRYGINMSSCPFNKKARLVVYHLLPTAITQV